MTREGYLFEWKTSAPSCQTEWPQFRELVAEDFSRFGNGAELGVGEHGAMMLRLLYPDKYVFRT